MLDSLVRVSRRVGWGADRTATDPQKAEGVIPTPHQPAVGRHRGRSLPVERAYGSKGPHRGGQLSSVHCRANTPASYNSSRRKSPSRWASDRQQTGRGFLLRKMRPRKLAPNKAPSCDRELRRTNNPKVEFHRRGCGPIRLPLNGFTYS